MRKIHQSMIAIAAIAVSTQASATVIDNFNDGSTAAWTAQSGTISEVGGTFSGSNMSLATWNGPSATKIGVDAKSSGGSIQYVALIMNYESLTNNLFVKMQDNNGNGLFDRVFMYSGNNYSYSAVEGYNYFDLSFEIEESFFELTDNLDGTISVFIEETEQTVTRSLVSPFSGTGLGLGFYGGATADNFYVDGGLALEPVAAVPAPAALGLFGLGLLGLGARVRRRPA